MRARLMELTIQQTNSIDNTRHQQTYSQRLAVLGHSRQMVFLVQVL